VLFGVSVDGRAVHLLSAMTHAERVVIAEREVDHTTNEITAFRPLLEDLDLTDCLVTADALHAPRDHANFLVEDTHAEYLLFVKENQPNFHNEMVCMGAERFAGLTSRCTRGTAGSRPAPSASRPPPTAWSSSPTSVSWCASTARPPTQRPASSAGPRRPGR